MKNKILLMCAFSFSLSTYAADPSKVDSDTEPFSLPTHSEESLATPTSLIIAKGPFDVNFKTFILAPTSGTELTLSISQSQLKYKYTNDNVRGQSNMTSTSEMIGLAYAINTSLFFGANITRVLSNSNSKSSSTYGSSYKYDSKSVGVSDPTVSVGTRINTNSTSTILALAGKIYTGDSKDKELSYTENSGTSESNIKNGGSSIIPIVSFHTNLENDLLLGTALSYEIKGERQTKSESSYGTSSSKAKDGNIQNISIFSEKKINNLIFGGSLDYTKVEAVTYIDSDNEKSTGSAISFSTLTGFVNIQMQDKLHLIPSLSYGKIDQGAKFINEQQILAANLLLKTSF